MTVLNNIYEIIGTDIKFIDDLAREEAQRLSPGSYVMRKRSLEKFLYIEEQLLDGETRAFMQEARIPQKLGYFLAYFYHIKRMSQPQIYNLIYEQTGQKVDVSRLFTSLNIPTRTQSEFELLVCYPNINFETYEQRPLLTDRQIEVLETKFEMGTNKATADVLDISLQTVKNHLYSAYKKLGVLCFTEAVVQAMERGLIPELPLPQQPTRALTERELEVLKTMIEMETQQAAADHLKISPNTVNSHLVIIRQKLKVNSTKGALEEARRRGYEILI